MFELRGFLVWLICIGISAILIGYSIKYYGMEQSIQKSEGFVVYACPSNSVKYITRNGETNCCNGDIVNNQCNGNNICSLSPTNSLNLQTCQTYVTNLANQASAANCFTDMPYYFASNDGSLRGCSLSHATPDGTAPSDPTKLQCILYPTEALDKVRLDSCYNYKLNKDKMNAKCASSSASSNNPSILGSIGSSIKSAASSVSSLGKAGAARVAGAAAGVAAAAAAPAAPVNPTGYVMSGEGISGNIPVQKIIAGITPSGGNFTFFFSQNGSSISIVWALTEDTNNILVSGDIPGKLSDHSFTDMPSFSNSTIGKTIDSTIIRKKYTVSKV